MPQIGTLGGLFVWLTVNLTACAQFSSSPTSWAPGNVIENSLLFHPVKATHSWVNPPGSVQVDDVWLRSTDGNRIHAWWLPRHSSQGAILFFHGNAGNLSFWVP